MPTDTFATPDFPELVLRPPQPADQTAIDQLYHTCRRDLHALPFPAELIDNLVCQQQQIQAHGVAQQYPAAQTMVLVPQDETARPHSQRQNQEQSLGHVLARIIFDQGQNDLRLIDIMVHPMVQRRGLARQLLRYLQQQATQHGVPLRLAVMKDNPNAIALYRACGFQVCSEDYLEQQMQWQAEVA